MDCQTFWRSNPKRLNQFIEARKVDEDRDWQAWATGYYVALAFSGKLPKKPDLVKAPERPLTLEETVAQYKAWAEQVNSKSKEAMTDG